MATALITEIQQAQTRLPLLSRADRAALIVRILRELKTHRREVLANVPAERCVWIDRLIASVSSTIPEIVNMLDAEFNRVLSEFEKLIATLDDISHAEKRSKIILERPAANRWSNWIYAWRQIALPHRPFPGPWLSSPPRHFLV